MTILSMVRVLILAHYHNIITQLKIFSLISVKHLNFNKNFKPFKVNNEIIFDEAGIVKTQL